MSEKLHCANVKTFEFLVFDATTLEFKYSYNLKENILKYPSEILSGVDNQPNGIFKSDEKGSTILWQLEYSPIDNSLVGLLYDSGSSDGSMTIVKFDQSGQVIWLTKVSCGFGMCIKEDSGSICLIDKVGLISETFNINGERLTTELPNSQPRIKLTHPSLHPNYQLNHYRGRYMFLCFNETETVPYTENEIAIVDMVDEQNSKLDSSTHPIHHTHGFSMKDSKCVHNYVIDRKRGLLFSVVNPGPLSSICITHLGSNSQLFTMGPLFVSSKYCKMVLNEDEQVLFLVTVSLESSAIEIQTFEYGRFNSQFLGETRRINNELFTSLKYLNPSDASFVQTETNKMATLLTKDNSSKLETIELERRNKNLQIIKEEYFYMEDW